MNSIIKDLSKHKSNLPIKLSKLNIMNSMEQLTNLLLGVIVVGYMFIYLYKK